MNPLGQLMLYIIAVVILVFAILALVAMVFLSSAKAFVLGKFDGITHIISSVFNYLSAVIAFLKSPLDSTRVNDATDTMVTNFANYMGIVDQATKSRVKSLLNTKLLIYPSGNTAELHRQNVQIADAVGGTYKTMIVQVVDAVDMYILTGKKIDLVTFGECFMNMVMKNCDVSGNIACASEVPFEFPSISVLPSC